MLRPLCLRLAALAIVALAMFAPAAAHAVPPPCATFCVAGAPYSCDRLCTLPAPQSGTIQCKNYWPANDICRRRAPSLTELASAIFSTAYASVSSASAGLIS